MKFWFKKNGAQRMKFKEGDLVIIKDRKGKTYLQKLSKNGRFQTHLGVLSHEEIMGKEEGTSLRTSTDEEVYVFYPTLNDFIQKMARKTAIIHPKDIGIILLWTDLKPGYRVVEAGTGSGALLLALSRYVGDEGMIYSYDNRPELQEIAIKNLEKFYGKMPKNIVLKQKDIVAGIDEKDVDCIILDIPEPWEVISEARKALRSGGKFASYIPTIIQAERLVKELETSSAFIDIEVLEVLLRPWQIRGFSVRPLHRIIGHTGFMVFAKLKKEERENV